ncbi:MAG: tetratricopeptide repeat protein [Acidobacteriota bacterium]
MVGAIVGTLEYMAPEQALAQSVDHRADIYAFGLMLFDMALGPGQRSQAGRTVAELLARVQKPLPRARSIDPSVPEPIERIIDRCTQPDASARYQSTRELVDDLAAVDAQRGFASDTASRVSITRATAPIALAHRKRVVYFAAAITLVVAGIGVWLVGDRLFTGQTPTAPQRQIALAVLPFQNASRDQTLDWLGPGLAELAGGATGQSPRLRILSQDRVFQLLRDLRVATSDDLASGVVRNVLEFANADTLVSGSLENKGDQIRINARVHHLEGEPTVLNASATSKDDLLRAAADLGRQIRGVLSIDAAALADLQARAFTPSTRSIQALQYYFEGMQLRRRGNQQAAINHFEEATRIDPEFALAHAGLARTLAASGRTAEAKQHAARAVDLSSRLPVEEQELVAAAQAAISDVDGGIAGYERLIASRPADVQLRFELAQLLENKGALDRASKEFSAVLELDPKYVDALLGAGRIAIRRREYYESLSWLNTAQTLAITFDNQASKATALHYLEHRVQEPPKTR